MLGLTEYFFFFTFLCVFMSFMSFRAVRIIALDVSKMFPSLPLRSSSAHICLLQHASYNFDATCVSAPWLITTSPLLKMVISDPSLKSNYCEYCLCTLSLVNKTT